MRKDSHCLLLHNSLAIGSSVQTKLKYRLAAFSANCCQCSSPAALERLGDITSTGKAETSLRNEIRRRSFPRRLLRERSSRLEEISTTNIIFQSREARVNLSSTIFRDLRNPRMKSVSAIRRTVTRRSTTPAYWLPKFSPASVQ